MSSMVFHLSNAFDLIGFRNDKIPCCSSMKTQWNIHQLKCFGPSSCSIIGCSSVKVRFREPETKPKPEPEASSGRSFVHNSHWVAKVALFETDDYGALVISSNGWSRKTKTHRTSTKYVLNQRMNRKALSASPRTRVSFSSGSKLKILYFSEKNVDQVHPSRKVNIIQLCSKVWNKISEDWWVQLRSTCFSSQ